VKYRCVLCGRVIKPTLVKIPCEHCGCYLIERVQEFSSGVEDLKRDTEKLREDVEALT